MQQNHEGPYKHYERPSSKRAIINKTGSRAWQVTAIFLVVVLVALVPVVHHLSSAEKTNERVVELQKSTKKKVHSKLKKMRKKKTKSTVQKQTRKKPQVNSQGEIKTKKKISQPTEYTVQTGDSLTSIADKFHLTVDELIQINQLDSTGQVNAGQVLKLK